MATNNLAAQVLGHARHLPANLARKGRWPTVLGTLLLAASTASVLATSNARPEITQLRMVETASEGQSVSLSGTVNDPDATDSHTVRIYWYGIEGAPDPREPYKQTLRLPAGQTTFEASHLYKDDLEPRKVKVVVFDNQMPPDSNDNTGGFLADTEYLPLEIRNVAPSIVAGSVTVQKAGGRNVVVEGKLADVSTEDTIMVEAKWGQGQGNAPTPCTMSEGDRRFRCEHTYSGIWGVPQTYHIGLRAIDDDGGIATHQTSVRLP